MKLNMAENVDFEVSEHWLNTYVAGQFATPTGYGGELTAAIMRIINWLPYRASLRRLSLRREDHVLEVGFGPGSGLKKLTKQTTQGAVFGVDRSKTMLSVATRRNEASIREGRLRLAEGTFEALPLSDRSIDVVLAVNILYFVEPLARALSEAHRVLKPGGRLVIYVSDNNHMPWLQFNGAETNNLFTCESLQAALEESAFCAGSIFIDKIWLPFRFRGIVAVATKIA